MRSLRATCLLKGSLSQSASESVSLGVCRGWRVMRCSQAMPGRRIVHANAPPNEPKSQQEFVKKKTPTIHTSASRVYHPLAPRRTR